MLRTFSLGVAALFTASPSQAAIYDGNIVLRFHVAHGTRSLEEGEVWVDSVDVEHCDGAVDTYVIDEDVDPVEGFQQQVGGGDLCAAVWHWSSDLDTEDRSGWVATHASTSSTEVSLKQSTGSHSLDDGLVLHQQVR